MAQGSPDRPSSEVEGAFEELHRLLGVCEDRLLVMFPSTASGVVIARTSLRASLTGAVMRLDEVAAGLDRLAGILGTVAD